MESHDPFMFQTASSAVHVVKPRIFPVAAPSRCSPSISSESSSSGASSTWTSAAPPLDSLEVPFSALPRAVTHGGMGTRNQTCLYTYIYTTYKNGDLEAWWMLMKLFYHVLPTLFCFGIGQFGNFNILSPAAAKGCTQIPLGFYILFNR